MTRVASYFGGIFYPWVWVVIHGLYRLKRLLGSRFMGFFPCSIKMARLIDCNQIIDNTTIYTTDDPSCHVTHESTFSSRSYVPDFFGPC